MNLKKKTLRKQIIRGQWARERVNTRNKYDEACSYSGFAHNVYIIFSYSLLVSDHGRFWQSYFFPILVRCLRHRHIRLCII